MYVIFRYWPLLLAGWLTTLQLTFWTLVGGFILSAPLALARSSNSAVTRYCALIIIDAVRGTPLIMLIFWIYFLLPRLIEAPVPAYIAGVLSLIVFNAAYSAEILRAGIQSVGHGQFDAARAAGMNWAQLMRLVVLPQAIVNMTPTIMSQVIMVYKATSLIFVIGVIDLFRAAIIVDSREFRSFEIYAFVGLVYLIPSAVVSFWSRTLDRRRSERRGAALNA